MGGYGMAAKMRELTEQNMQEFVKEVEKRKIPLHSVLIAQHGNLLYEKYYAPYCRNKLQNVFCDQKLYFTGNRIIRAGRENFPAGFYLWLFSGISARESASLAGRDDD